MTIDNMLIQAYFPCHVTNSANGKIAPAVPYFCHWQQNRPCRFKHVLEFWLEIRMSSGLTRNEFIPIDQGWLNYGSQATWRLFKPLYMTLWAFRKIIYLCFFYFYCKV